MAESSQIREQMVQALSYLLDTAVISHAFTQALNYAAQLLEIEPWLERAHQQLMLLYGRNNRIDAALSQYEKCQQILADELGVSPAAETDALYERLLLARDEEPFPLPDDGTVFIGRQQQLTHIMKQITQPTCRLLTIVGLGGMGKTRLAIATAREVIQGSERQFLNGAVFVPLVGVINESGLLNGILAALDIPPTTGRLRNQVLEVLKQREMLLVLDNFEELLDEVGLIEQIINNCPDITLLVTSREALGITAEYRLDLDGLLIPNEEHSSAESADFEAVALFMSIAQQIQPKFTLDEQTTPNVLALCHLVGGMPLALKLAATWLRALPIDEIVTQLQSGLDILATRLRDVPIRQRSMRAILEQTVSMLMVDEAAVLYALSIFRNGFTASAAQAVTKANPFILSELSDRGLIQLDETGRYRLHELTRQFAAEKLEQTADLHRDYAHYFAEFAAQAYEHFLAGSTNIAMTHLHQERGNMRQAWRWLLALIAGKEQLERDVTALAKFIHPVGWYFQQRAFYKEGGELLTVAVTVLAEVSSPAEENSLITITHTRATIRLTELLYYQGSYDETDRLLAQALPLAQNYQLVNDEAFLHHVATASARRQGHFEQAKLSAQRSEQLYLQAGNKIEAMVGLGHRAMIAADEGVYQLAEESAQQLISFYRQINHQSKVLRWLSNLGNTYFRQGNYSAAQHKLEEAYHLARTQNDRLGIIMTLTNLSSVYMGLGSLQQGETYALESMRLAREIGSQRWVAINLAGLSRLALVGSNGQKPHVTRLKG